LGFASLNPNPQLHVKSGTVNELPRSKLRGINLKNPSIYLPAVKNLIERRSKLQGIKPPLGD
jgi:hypothetical protein